MGQAEDATQRLSSPFLSFVLLMDILLVPVGDSLRDLGSVRSIFSSESCMNSQPTGPYSTSLIPSLLERWRSQASEGRAWHGLIRTASNEETVRGCSHSTQVVGYAGFASIFEANSKRVGDAMIILDADKVKREDVWLPSLQALLDLGFAELALDEAVFVINPSDEQQFLETVLSNLRVRATKKTVEASRTVVYHISRGAWQGRGDADNLEPLLEAGGEVPTLGAHRSREDKVQCQASLQGTNIELEPMDLHDVKQYNLLQYQRSICGWFESDKVISAWRAEIDDPTKTEQKLWIILGRSAGNPEGVRVGHIFYNPHLASGPNQRDAYIGGFFILPAYNGLGVGRRVMNMLIERARTEAKATRVLLNTLDRKYFHETDLSSNGNWSRLGQAAPRIKGACTEDWYSRQGFKPTGREPAFPYTYVTGENILLGKVSMELVL